DTSGVPAQIQALQSSVNALQSSVKALQSTVNTLQTTSSEVLGGIDALTGENQSNVRWTPGFYLVTSNSQSSGFPNRLFVSVTNVGSVAHTIKAELVDDSGNVLSPQFQKTLQSLQSMFGDTGAGQDGMHRVRFTVVDGSRTDIRASAQTVLNCTVAPCPPLALGPVLAAE